MEDGRFNLLFRGEVLESFTQEQVKKNIAERYGKAPEKIERFFSGGTFALARDLPWSEADRLSKELQALGAFVYVQEVEPESAPAAPQEEPPAPAPPPPARAEQKVARPEPSVETRTETGQDAPDEGAHVSRRSLIRYRFDSFMAKGGSSIFKALVVTFVGLFLLIGLARGLFQWLAPESTLQYGELDFWGNLYITFLQLTDPGNMAQDILSSPSYKPFAVVAGLSGVIMLSALVAFITTALDQKINALKRGRSKVIESGHTLILGWNEQRIVEILRELILANESESDACVVILADRDKEEMDDILRLRLPDTKTTRLVTRSGAVSTIANLDMVSIETAKSVIALSLCEDTAGADEKAASDAMVIQTILAASGKAPGDDDFSIVAEIYNPTHREIVEASFGDHVVTVNTSDVLAKLLVQTSRSVGLSVVYNEILSFDGCEMYFFGDDWGGLCFQDLACRFPDGVPMGVRHGNGEVVLNPEGGYRMRDDDEILIVAEDDSTIEFVSEPVARPRNLELPDGRLSQSIERELLLGWNHKAPVVLNEFADYVKPGSEIHVMLKGPSDAVRAQIEALDAELESVEVQLLEEDCMNRDQLMARKPFEYDNIILLAGGGDEEADVQQIDSRNIVTLLLLRSIFSRFPEESRDTKLITEVLDSQNHPLVARAGVKDIVISNRLVSMIMAQVSESRDIKLVYDDIFQEDGSEIYLKPASLYFSRLPATVTFADLIGLARKRDEVCIGFKQKELETDDEQNYGVKLIPEKNTRLTVNPDDCLIVLAEDEL
ncbi:MAG: hypothetical protein QNK04_32990 [Myxococcota bacterium]|nr:hypothetical protein [Myxococcota bacterium]